MAGYDYHGVQVPPADPEAVRKDREDAEKQGYGFYDGARGKNEPKPAPNPDGPYGGPYQG